MICMKKKGLSDDEIDDLLVLDIKNQNYFDEGGVENQHGGGGLLFSRDKRYYGMAVQPEEIRKTGILRSDS